MSKFVQYLKEDDIDKLNENWARVEKDCAPVLRDLRKIGDHYSPEYFLRGTDRDAPKYGEIRDVRKDRKPKDTAQFAHAVADDYFLAKHGFRLRSQGLFVKRRGSGVSIYGSPHIILPIGKYQIYWSKEVKDLLNIIGNTEIKNDLFKEFEDENGSLSDDVYKLVNKMITALDKDVFEKEFPEHVALVRKILVDKLDEQAKYTKGNLRRAFKTLSEIVIECDRYWIFPQIRLVENKIFPEDS